MKKKQIVIIVGLIVVIMVIVFAAANINIRMKRKNVKFDIVKCPRLKKPGESIASTQEAETLIGEKMFLSNVFYDHEEKDKEYQGWSAVNAYFDPKKEMWIPDPHNSHIDYTMAFFDQEQGGRILFRKQKQQRGEIILSQGDAICFSSGPENEFRVTGHPIYYHFRSKPFAPTDEFVSIRERARILRDFE